MKNTFENNVLTIYLEGNVDTSNAEQVGQEIDEIRAANPDGSFVLDMENLKYISSAGLRQILRLKKKESDFKIINCSSEIYEIFDMTGFAEMMDIEKGYRQMSVEGCEKSRREQGEIRPEVRRRRRRELSRSYRAQRLPA